MNILHLIPSLDYNGAAAQLGLLSKHLPDTQIMNICCLGGEGPWAERLRKQHRTVDCLRWTRVFDPTPPWKLHRLLKSMAPDLIHAWGAQSLRALGLVGRRWLSRTIVSRPLPHRSDQGKPFDRWLLRRVRTVAASSQAEAALCREAGVREQQLAVVPPGVEAGASPLEKRTGPGCDPLFQRAAKSILCIGALEARKGFRDALWTFDMLHVVFGDSRLILAGDGPDRADLERFAAAVEIATSVDFLGRRDDVHQLLRAADVCWIPTLMGASGQVALEAMAAGCPVVATNQPGLRELIADGRTGFLVPPGDKVTIGKRTRSLFLDADLGRQIGAAGWEHVRKHFAPQACVERWMEQYAAAA